MTSKRGPVVGILMGSTSDWEGTMRFASEVLQQFEIAHECRAISAHRTPEAVAEYCRTAEGRGLKAIIAGAGGAAHLAGVAAAFTPLPVLGVPVQSKSLQGLDSLLSMVQMPGGIPVGTFAIGDAGARNAALFVVRMLATTDNGLKEKLRAFHKQQEEKVLAARLPVHDWPV